jgi:hypothetical protein
LQGPRRDPRFCRFPTPEGGSTDGESFPRHSDRLPSSSLRGSSRAPRRSSPADGLSRSTESVPRHFDRAAPPASRLPNRRGLCATTWVRLSRSAESFPRNAERPTNIDLSVPRFDD